jgi:hypothetical protein
LKRVLIFLHKGDLLGKSQCQAAGRPGISIKGWRMPSHDLGIRYGPLLARGNTHHQTHAGHGYNCTFCGRYGLAFCLSLPSGVSLNTPLFTNRAIWWATPPSPTRHTALGQDHKEARSGRLGE